MTPPHLTPQSDSVFISPLHNIETPVHREKLESRNSSASITPLYNFEVEKTPQGAVEFTPIKTPWKSDVSGTSPTSPSFKRIEASENIDERNTDIHTDLAKNMMLFTPVSKVKHFLSPSQESVTKNQRDHTNATSTSNKTDLELFYENNKLIFTPDSTTKTTDLLLKDSMKLDKTPSRDKTPSMNLMNLITPFKDPNSPLNDNDETITPINLNISAEEVDNFIDEVISNTSKNTPSSLFLFFLLIL